MAMEDNNLDYCNLPIDELFSKFDRMMIKVWIEGESLCYKAPKGVVSRELIECLKGRKAEIIERIKLKEAEKAFFEHIQPVEKKKYYELSTAQRRMFIVNQFEGNSTNYDIYGAQLIEGRLEVDRLEEIFKTLIKRHDSLRTSFKMIDGEPVQEIHEKVDFRIEHYYEVDENNLNRVIESFVRPFDLSRAPLIRVGLARISPTKHLLMYDMHHIISDAASMSVLTEEFVKLYCSQHLPELTIQYKDFIEWQNKMLNSVYIKKQEDYWLDVFKKEIPVLNLPSDYPRSAVADFNGDNVDFEIDEEMVTELNKLSMKNGATLFMTILASFNVLLSRCSGQDDIILGTPVAGRRHADLKNQIGVFLNTLALRNYPSPNKTFIEFLHEVRDNSLKAFENQDYQFEMLLDRLRPKRELGRNPLFDVMINFLIDQKLEINNGYDNLKITPVNIDAKLSKFDMTLYIYYSPTKTRFSCVYRTSLFKRSTIEYLMGQYKKLLCEIVKDSKKKLYEYEIFKRSELLVKGNAIKPNVPFEEFPISLINQSIIDKFEGQVVKFGNKTAVVKGDKSLSYSDLNKFANRIAHVILKYLTIKQGTSNMKQSISSKKSKQDITTLKTDKNNFNGEIMRDSFTQSTVALLFDHGINMIPAVFGTLKTGSIYVPLDPNYPKDRLKYMLSDSKAVLLVTDNKNIELAKSIAEEVSSSITIVNVDKIPSHVSDSNPQIHIEPSDKAYILYTSGSTGNPKGVIQNHRNVLYYISAYTNNLHINSNDRLTLFSSFSHDAAVVDIFSALLNGATLYPYNIKGDGGLLGMKKWLNDEKITVYHSIPTLYRYFTDTLEEEKGFYHIRAVVLGGEAVYSSDVEAYKKYFSDSCLFVNLMGSSEASITMLNFIDKNTEITRSTVPSGFPIEGMEVLLLERKEGHNDEINDEQSTHGFSNDLENLLSAGKDSVDVFNVGEIAYKSRYLALGYLNNEEKTMEVFFKTKDGEDMRIYKSGDLGRVLLDGSIEHTGRADYQIKIRGYRIELGEIESAVNGMEGICRSVAVAHPDESGENHIALYYTLEHNANISPDEIKNAISQKLPDFMVPSFVIRLNELPVTPNGKIDRKRLPKPDMNGSKAKEFVPPANEIEESLANIWKSVLKVDEISMVDDFFELGGNSLLVLKLEAELEKRGFKTEDFAVFKYDTVRKMASLLMNKNGKSGDGALDSGHNGEAQIANDLSAKDDGIYNNADLVKQTQVTILEQNGDYLENEASAKILENIEPFNDVFYKNCFYNSSFPVLKYYGKSVITFLINDVLVYTFDAASPSLKLSTQYVMCDTVENVLEREGVALKVIDVADDVVGEIIKSINNKLPVVIWVDCFFASIRADAYKKNHWPHTWLVYGFNEAKKKFYIIEHTHRDNLTYTRQEVSFNELTDSYYGYVKNFRNKNDTSPTYYEFSMINGDESCGQGSEDMMQDYRSKYVSNMLSKNNLLSEGLESIKIFKRKFLKVISDEELLKKNAEHILSGVNDIINAKNVEKYKIRELFKENESLMQNIDGIIGKWTDIRVVLGKYIYTSMYKKEKFILAADKLEQIYNLEKDYLECFGRIKNLKIN